MDTDRRRALGAGAAAAAALFLGGTGRAPATVHELEAAIAKLGGTREPAAGRLTLSLPKVAENGHSVPVSLSVESPMTERDHVVAAMILAPDNPNVEVATFRFTPKSGRAQVTTRMRLATTQEVVAVARLADGGVLRTSTPVRVVVGGCGA